MKPRPAGLIARTLEELRLAKVAAYQYEQALLVQGRDDVARTYAERYNRIGKLIEEWERLL